LESAALLPALFAPEDSGLDQAGLVEQARRGAPGAAEALWRSQSRPLIRTAIALGVRPEDAEDVVQESLLHAFSQFDRFDSTRSPFSLWLHRILVGRCSNRRRAARRFMTAVARLAGVERRDPPIAPDQAMERREATRALEALVKDLPPRRRAVWALTQISGLSTAEVAGILGMTEATVRSHLRHAAESMRRAMEVSG
jgi:RNA polymerase sigma-70 factor (ECF subfamily)